MNNRRYEHSIKITCPIEKRSEIEARILEAVAGSKHETQLLKVGFDLAEEVYVQPT